MQTHNARRIILNKSTEKQLKSMSAMPFNNEAMYFSAPVKLKSEDEFLSPTELYELTATLKKQSGLAKLPVLPASDLNDFGPALTPFCEVIKNKAAPLFSIVIPTYERKRQLKATLRAIQDQTLSGESFEVIVVDDGSTDDTQQLLKEEATSSRCNFKAFYLKREKSEAELFRAATTRNIGANAASGKFIIFVDSDILLPPNFTEQLVEKTKSYKVIQPLRSEAGSLTDDEFLSPLLKQDWNSFENKWKFLCTYCLCIEAKLFKKIGGFRNTFSSYGLEDTELGYRLALVGENFYLMKATVIHQESGPQRTIFAKRKEMARSAQLFYNTYLDESIYYEYIWLWSSLPFEKKLSSLRIARILLQKRGFKNLAQKSFKITKSYLASHFS